jgi:hypothetical protein
MANWNTRLRWIHLAFGLMISAYFFPITMNQDVNFWDDRPQVTMFVGGVVMAVVVWTGIVKWQLPRIKKWNRNRKKAAVAAE